MPAPPSIDILALGNAIVDVLSHVDDATIDALPVNKGAMTLIGVETTVTNQHGVHVADTTRTIVVRNG